MHSNNFQQMTRYIHRKCTTSKWLEPVELGSSSMIGVAIRLPNNTFINEPPTLNNMVIDAIKNINPAVAFTMSSDITAAVFRQLSPYQDEIVVQPRGIRIPIIETFSALSTGHSTIFNSFACLVRKEKVMLVWAASVEGILSHGSHIETKLLGWVCLTLIKTCYMKRELIPFTGLGD